MNLLLVAYIQIFILALFVVMYYIIVKQKNFKLAQSIIFIFILFMIFEIILVLYFWKKYKNLCELSNNIYCNN